MKQFVSILIAISLSLSVFGAEPIKILAIGNSFSEDAIEQNLFEMAAAEGQPMIIGNMYIGGCTIEKHYNNIIGDIPAYEYRKLGLDGVKHTSWKYKLSQAIADEQWDFVSIQQASGKSGLPETYAHLSEIVEWIKENAPQAKIIFHQTWAYAPDADHSEFPIYGRDQMKMFDAIMAASLPACKEVGIETIVPSGSAIQIARATSLGKDLTRDGYHLDLQLGRYIAAACWFETLLGKNILENGYIPAWVGQKYSLEDLYKAREAAHIAVRSR